MLTTTASAPKMAFRRVGTTERGLMETATRWYHIVAYFFGGAFLANTIPHLVSGISGSPFQSPFGSPPGQGLSSATTNVLWGMFNLVVAYVLVARVGRLDLRRTWHAVAIGLGVLLMALMLRTHSGSSTEAICDQPPRAGSASARSFAGKFKRDNMTFLQPTAQGIARRTCEPPHSRGEDRPD